MSEKEMLSEELLDGWLSMSMAIWNERLVSAMTYNESMVCNLLYKQRKTEGEPLTATVLCAKLQITKPQMNVILNRLEASGIIERIRSREDKRKVHIRLTEQGVPVYETAHREILRFPQMLIARLGEDKCRTFAASMKEVAGCFNELMKNGGITRSKEGEEERIYEKRNTESDQCTRTAGTVSGIPDAVQK